MHLLTSLVKFRNDIDKNIIDLSLNKAINDKITLLKNIPDPIKNRFTLSDIHEQYHTLLVDADNIIQNLKTLSDTVTKEILAISEKMFCSEDYHNKWLGFSGREAINYDSWPLFSYRMNQYSDWRYPGMVVDPCNKLVIDKLVSSDPLYILTKEIDQAKELVSDYPNLYQQRLLIYNEEDMFQYLPKDQIGVIALFDMFTNLTLPKIKSYLKKLLPLLRPGGVIIFTYNNCDIEEMSQRAVDWAIPYASKTTIQNIINDLKVDLISFKDRPTGDPFVPYMSWAEIRKPGELTTIKRSQPIGEIVLKK